MRIVFVQFMDSNLEISSAFKANLEELMRVPRKNGFHVKHCLLKYEIMEIQTYNSTVYLLYVKPNL